MARYLIAILIFFTAFSVPVSASPIDGCQSNDQLTTFKAVLERAACAGKITTPNATGETQSIINLVGGVLTIAYSLLGIVFVTLLVYAGYLWLTARGNEEQVTRAQTLLRNSLIGIIIVFTAFIISREIVSLLKDVTDGTV